MSTYFLTNYQKIYFINIYQYVILTDINKLKKINLRKCNKTEKEAENVREGNGRINDRSRAREKTYCKSCS